MTSEQESGALTYDRLTHSERAVAWAVIRTLATAFWIGSALMIATWVLLLVVEKHLPQWMLIPSAGVLGIAAVLEVKSRDLERPES